MVLRMFVLMAMAASLIACSPSRTYHGFIPDDTLPTDIEPVTDTRSSVLARLGSPSTKGNFDEHIWYYVSASYERFSYRLPKPAERKITAIRFDDDGYVSDVLTYDINAGKVIRYASRETPTRGRELGLLEQIFGNVGRMALPQERRNPGQ